MKEILAEFLTQASWPLIAAIIVGCLAVLARAADWLVDEAVALSERSGLPKVVIGATVVSLGTTTPEAVVSVLAALQGRPGLALGNAVGSIICDTGLILGLACLIAPLPLDRKIVNRQGWIQFGSGVLLVLSCIPWSNPGAVFETGGVLPRAAGVLFLFLLVVYLALTVRWSRSSSGLEMSLESTETGSVPVILLKLCCALTLVVVSSWVLIPAVAEAAVRLSVPESIIAATLVAFGTSLPELVTAIAAVRQNHGELAIGNVIGADILNVLFVAGAAAAATSGGLSTPVHFFSLYFPSMLGILIVFRIGILTSGTHLKRGFGLVLLGTYLLVTVLSFVGR